MMTPAADTRQRGGSTLTEAEKALVDDVLKTNPIAETVVLSRWGAYKRHVRESVGILESASDDILSLLKGLEDRGIEVHTRYGTGTAAIPTKNVCTGHCEGTGWIPVYIKPEHVGEGDIVLTQVETDERLIQRWNNAHEAAGEHDCDGYHFVRCPDCGGDGKLHESRKQMLVEAKGRNKGYIATEYWIGNDELSPAPDGHEEWACKKFGLESSGGDEAYAEQRYSNYGVAERAGWSRVIVMRSFGEIHVDSGGAGELWDDLSSTEKSLLEDLAFHFDCAILFDNKTVINPREFKSANESAEPTPHYGMKIVKDYNRVMDGGRIADVQCIGCGRAWKEVNLGKLPRSSTPYCSKCKRVYDESYALAEKLWWDGAQENLGQYRSEDQNGMYALARDIFMFNLRGVEPSPTNKYKLKKVGILDKIKLDSSAITESDELFNPEVVTGTRPDGAPTPNKRTPSQPEAVPADTNTKDMFSGKKFEERPAIFSVMAREPSVEYPMFKRDQPAIGTFSQKSPENLARMIVFVIASIKTSWPNMQEYFPPLWEHLQKTGSVSYSEQDKPVWAALVVGKGESIKQVWEDRQTIFDGAMKAVADDTKAGNTGFLVYEFFTKVPGLGAPKAGFATQLLIGKYGCIDSVNLNLLKTKQPTHLMTKDGKAFKPVGQARGSGPVLSPGEMEKLINSNRLTPDQKRLVVYLYGDQTPASMEVVKGYGDYLAALNKEGISSEQLWNLWCETIGAKIYYGWDGRNRRVDVTMKGQSKPSQVKTYSTVKPDVLQRARRELAKGNVWDWNPAYAADKISAAHRKLITGEALQRLLGRLGINESELATYATAPIWIGSIDSYGAVQAVKTDAGRTENGYWSDSQVTHAKLGLPPFNKWRYVVGTSTIWWWHIEDATEEHKSAVENFLASHGCTTRNHKQMTDMLKVGGVKRFGGDLSHGCVEAVIRNHEGENVYDQNGWWVDPDGNIRPLDGSTHADWAYNYLEEVNPDWMESEEQSDNPDDIEFLAFERLISDGWVRLVDTKDGIACSIPWRFVPAHQQKEIVDFSIEAGKKLFDNNYNEILVESLLDGIIAIADAERAKTVWAATDVETGKTVYFKANNPKAADRAMGDGRAYQTRKIRPDQVPEGEIVIERMDGVDKTNNCGITSESYEQNKHTRSGQKIARSVTESGPSGQNRRSEAHHREQLPPPDDAPPAPQGSPAWIREVGGWFQAINGARVLISEDFLRRYNALPNQAKNTISTALVAWLRNSSDPSLKWEIPKFPRNFPKYKTYADATCHSIRQSSKPQPPNFDVYRILAVSVTSRSNPDKDMDILFWCGEHRPYEQFLNGAAGYLFPQDRDFLSGEPNGVNEASSSGWFGGKWWMEPDGTVHDIHVAGERTHEEWALGYCAKNGIQPLRGPSNNSSLSKEAALEKLIHLGWVRLHQQGAVVHVHFKQQSWGRDGMTEETRRHVLDFAAEHSLKPISVFGGDEIVESSFLAPREQSLVESVLEEEFHCIGYKEDYWLGRYGPLERAWGGHSAWCEKRLGLRYGDYEGAEAAGFLRVVLFDNGLSITASDMYPSWDSMTPDARAAIKEKAIELGVRVIMGNKTQPDNAGDVVFDPSVPESADNKPEVIAIDLDGTLAHYDEFIAPDVIGEPIQPMISRVKRWIEEGKEVRIFTARVSSENKPEDVELARNAIKAWCVKHVGQELQITSEKAPDIAQFYDDRAHRVEQNTGKVTESRITLNKLRRLFDDAARGIIDDKLLDDVYSEWHSFLKWQIERYEEMVSMATGEDAEWAEMHAEDAARLKEAFGVLDTYYSKPSAEKLHVLNLSIQSWHRVSSELENLLVDKYNSRTDVAEIVSFLDWLSSRTSHSEKPPKSVIEKEEKNVSKEYYYLGYTTEFGGHTEGVKTEDKKDDHARVGAKSKEDVLYWRFDPSDGIVRWWSDQANTMEHESAEEWLKERGEKVSGHRWMLHRVGKRRGWEWQQELEEFEPVTEKTGSGIHYDKAIVMFRIEYPNVLQEIEHIQRAIPKDDLYFDPEDKAKSGLENESHVTVLWGIAPGQVDLVSKILSNAKPFEIELGEVSAFKNDGYDVLKIEVIPSKELISIRKSLESGTENEQTFPDYRPHITLAYLKPGASDKHIGKCVLTGTKLIVKKLLFKDAGDDGDRIEKEFLLSPELLSASERQIVEASLDMRASTVNNSSVSLRAGLSEADAKADKQRTKPGRQRNAGRDDADLIPAEDPNQTYTVLPESDITPLADGEKWWITPGGRWIWTDDHEQSAPIILKALGIKPKDTSRDMSANYVQLHDRGWLRVVNDMGDSEEQIYLTGLKGQEPTADQLRSAKDACAAQGCELYLETYTATPRLLFDPKEDGVSEGKSKEKVWKVVWADGRGVQYFDNETAANKFHDQPDRDADKPELIVKPNGARVKSKCPPPMAGIKPESPESLARYKNSKPQTPATITERSAYSIDKTVMEPRNVMICPCCNKEIGEKESFCPDFKNEPDEMIHRVCGGKYCTPPMKRSELDKLVPWLRDSILKDYQERGIEPREG